VPDRPFPAREDPVSTKRTTLDERRGVRKLVVTENITLDGVIDASGGWFSPVGDDDADESDIAEELREQAAAADALLLGRVTFEEFRGYWPQQTDDETGVTEYLNTVEKYVVSRTMTDPAWDRSTVLSGDLEAEVRSLKDAPGRDIVSTGSITLVQELIRLGLVDEYSLFAYPVVLGRGARLFQDATGIGTLTLLDSRAFRCGVVLLRYASREGRRDAAPPVAR
jgi:dihydrofolate reductase